MAVNQSAVNQSVPADNSGGDVPAVPPGSSDAPKWESAATEEGLPISDSPPPQDTDGDGRSDKYEMEIGTNPFGLDLDSDSDGLPDLLERRLGTNPHDADSDGDGESDGEEDRDRDGIPNAVELRLRLNPHERDSDNDGISDGSEDADDDGRSNEDELTDGTDPLNSDTDGDGRSDGDELKEKTDPKNPDTDGDGILDGDDPLKTPPGARDVLLLKRAGWECAGGTWRFREWHTYERRWYDSNGNVIRREVRPEHLAADQNSGRRCEPGSPIPADLTLGEREEQDPIATNGMEYAQLPNWTTGTVEVAFDDFLESSRQSSPVFGAHAAHGDGGVGFALRPSLDTELNRIPFAAPIASGFSASLIDVAIAVMENFAASPLPSDEMELVSYR